MLFFSLTVMLILGAAYQCVNDSLFRAMIALAQQSELLASRYFGEVTPEHVFADGWRGMQAAIPFRVELSPAGDQPVNVGQPRNWGLTLRPVDSAMMVVDIAESSPFFGFLFPQDRIIGIDTVREERTVDLVEYLNSRDAGETRIFFERDGRADSVIVQIAATESINDASAEIEDSIGYLALKLPSSSDLDRDLEKLRGSGAQEFIIDLRGSRGDDHDQADALLGQIERITDDRPTVVLIDAASKGTAEELARRLSRLAHVVTMGTTSAGTPAVVDEIELRSGRRLYVSLNERFPWASEEAIDTATKSSFRVTSSTAVVPATGCGDARVSALLLELIHGGHMLDFVSGRHFSIFPRPGDEDSLLAEFNSYLRLRKFRYDPLGRTLSDMGLNDMNHEMTPIYQHMRQTHQRLGDLDISEFREEILRNLLKLIHRVKIGGAPSLTIRARTDDACLAAALAYLKGQKQ